MPCTRAERCHSANGKGSPESLTTITSKSPAGRCWLRILSTARDSDCRPIVGMIVEQNKLESPSASPGRVTVQINLCCPYCSPHQIDVGTTYPTPEFTG